MKLIAYTLNGELELLVPAPGFRLALGAGEFAFDRPYHVDRLSKTVRSLENLVLEDESEFVARVQARDLPPGAQNVCIIDSNDAPSDRTFRDAWKQVGDKIEVDMPKARDIHREHLRQLREPLFVALDVAYQQADERGDAAAKRKIAIQKQALRDITADPRIEAARSPDELKAILAHLE